MLLADAKGTPPLPKHLRETLLRHSTVRNWRGKVFKGYNFFRLYLPVGDKLNLWTIMYL